MVILLDNLRKFLSQIQFSQKFLRKCFWVTIYASGKYYYAWSVQSWRVCDLILHKIATKCQLSQKFIKNIVETFSNFLRTFKKIIIWENLRMFLRKLGNFSEIFEKIPRKLTLRRWGTQKLRQNELSFLLLVQTLAEAVDMQMISAQSVCVHTNSACVHTNSACEGRGCTALSQKASVQLWRRWTERGRWWTGQRRRRWAKIRWSTCNPCTECTPWPASLHCQGVRCHWCNSHSFLCPPTSPLSG